MTPDQIGEYLEHQGATDDEIDEFLEHFGVKGMKWGQRKARTKSEPMTREERRKKANRTAIKTGLGVGAGTLALGYLAASSLSGGILGKSTKSIVASDLRSVGEKAAYPLLVAGGVGAMALGSIRDKVRGL
jgi:hypothetical protein